MTPSMYPQKEEQQGEKGSECRQVEAEKEAFFVLKKKGGVLFPDSRTCT